MAVWQLSMTFEQIVESVKQEDEIQRRSRTLFLIPFRTSNTEFKVSAPCPFGAGCSDDVVCHLLVSLFLSALPPPRKQKSAGDRKCLTTTRKSASQFSLQPPPLSSPSLSASALVPLSPPAPCKVTENASILSHHRRPGVHCWRQTVSLVRGFPTIWVGLTHDDARYH